jgi:nickel-dependent lactate racemase
MRTALPWRMWHEVEELGLDWPDGWLVEERPMTGAPALTASQVADTVRAPVAGPAPAELAAGRRNACILIDDLTRPTPAGAVARPLVEALCQGGLERRDIFFIVANGAHRALTRADLLKKLGAELLDAHVVMRHDTVSDLVHAGELCAGDPTRSIGPLMVNRFFAEADLKLAVTGVVPHFMAGFSGGAKIVMPAVCGLETIAATHAHTVEGLPGRVGVTEGNVMREIMTHAAELVGLAWTANAVFNAEARAAGVHCGPPRAAHRAAVRQARQVYATDVAPGADVAVFNAFPKDTEFIQAMAALNIWADRQNPARDLVREGGTIVVVCACPEGLGAHGLIEYGRRHFRRRDEHGSFRRILGGRHLLFLAPGVGRATMELHYPPRAGLFRNWPALRAELERLHPGGARAVVYPTSALQLDRAIVAQRARA